MLELWQGMPRGVRVFLVYGFSVLAIVGLTTPLIISQAVDLPVSPIGIVWMFLLAYLIFTLTLVLQRKQAAYPLAFGLATLSVPLILVMLVSGLGGLPGAIIVASVSLIVFWSLRRPGVHDWFNEQ